MLDRLRKRQRLLEILNERLDVVVLAEAQVFQVAEELPVLFKKTDYLLKRL